MQECKNIAEWPLELRGCIFAEHAVTLHRSLPVLSPALAYLLVFAGLLSFRGIRKREKWL